MRLTMLAATLVATLPFAANAAAIIENGTIRLGVFDLGNLNVYPSESANPATGSRPVGVFRIDGGASGLEATSNGCLCEGWGAGADGIGGSANRASVTSGFTLVSFASTASTATSVVTLNGTGLKVTHFFTPAAETQDLYRVRVTMENTGLTDIADLRYSRTFDWDVDPTAFSEYVTIKGTGTTTSLLYSNNNGFENSNPYALRTPIGSSATEDSDFTDFGLYDQGSQFDFGFGALAAGEKYEFDIFYGASTTERGALNALGEVGAELFSLGQPNCDPLGTGSGTGACRSGTATFVFGFSGVGGDIIIPDPTPDGAVPVPASAVLLLSGLAALGLRRARKLA